MSLIIDLKTKILSEQSQDARFALFVETFKTLGVESFCYGFAPFQSESDENGLLKSVFFKNTHCEEWQNLFLKNQISDDEITMQRLVKESKGTVWHDPEIYSILTDSQKDVFHIEDELGLTVGVTIPLKDFKNHRCISGIGLSLPNVEKNEYDAFWATHGATIVQLSVLMEETCFLNDTSMLVQLSEREKDSLSYLAIGLRPDEIAYRMKISTRTLEKHISSAKQKLKSSTRDQALAKAIKIGLIAP